MEIAMTQPKKPNGPNFIWDMSKPSDIFDEHRRIAGEQSLTELRDEFAKAAMLEILQAKGIRATPSEIAGVSYRLADAMLAERKK
jgi:hypothetical protein